MHDPTGRSAATPPMQRAARSRSGLAGALLVLLVLGGALTYLGVTAVVAELRLRDGGTTIQAEVLATRVLQPTGDDMSGPSYDVRYRFTPPGSREVYSAADGSWRQGLWMSMPAQDWEVARRSKKLLVRYLPADPWINRPVKHGGMSLGDPIAGLLVGLAMALPSLLLLIGLFRRPARPPVAPSR